MRILAAVLCVFACVGSRSVLAQEPSELWGKSGEKWSATGRLPDFSYAGYHCGEAAIPDVKQSVDVTDFGAKGDGEHDDTEALVKAIATAGRGAVYLPPGRYRLTRIIEITKSDVVLRGAGPDKTVLFFPTPLNDIQPNWGATTGGRRTSNWSWSGGLLWIKGERRPDDVLAEIAEPALRGDTSLTLASSEKVKPGLRVEIIVSDDKDRTLLDYLYSGDPGDTRKFPHPAVCRMAVSIRTVEGNRITFDRPLRFDVRPEWKPRVVAFAPTVRECGIEHLAFEFPVTPYKGHFTEVGFNPVALSNCSDCWVRDVRIVNADSGFMVSASFCTITDVIIESARGESGGCTGHHGIILSGRDNLFTRFDFRTRFIHDLTVTRGSVGNVFSAGKGVNLCFDHHKDAPYENCHTDLDVGAGTRLWRCGGGASLGKNCGARGTFWNIRSQRPLVPPGSGFGPKSMNFVALTTDQPAKTGQDGVWWEAIDPEKMLPPDIHKAQLQRRLAGMAQSGKDQ